MYKVKKRDGKIIDFDIDNLDDWCSDNDIDIDEIINDTIYDAVY